MVTYILVQSFGNKVSTALKFLNLNIFIDGTDKQGAAIVKLIIEVHIIDNLKANIFIGISVLIRYSILLDLSIQSAVII